MYALKHSNGDLYYTNSVARAVKAVKAGVKTYIKVGCRLAPLCQ